MGKMYFPDECKEVGKHKLTRIAIKSIFILLCAVYGAMIGVGLFNLWLLIGIPLFAIVYLMVFIEYF